MISAGMTVPPVLAASLCCPPWLLVVCARLCLDSGPAKQHLHCSSPSCVCALQCIDRSRQRLRMDKLDLLQFYWADYAVEGYVGAALHLAELQVGAERGLVGVAI